MEGFEGNGMKLVKGSLICSRTFFYQVVLSSLCEIESDNSSNNSQPTTMHNVRYYYQHSLLNEMIYRHQRNRLVYVEGLKKSSLCV
jgi:hypothetical protein